MTVKQDWTTEPHVWGRKNDPATFMETKETLLQELIGAAGEVAIMVGPEAQDPRIRRLADLWSKWRRKQ